MSCALRVLIDAQMSREQPPDGRSKCCSLVHYPGVGSLPRVSARGRQSQVLRTRGAGGKPRLDVPLMSSSKGETQVHPPQP